MASYKVCVVIALACAFVACSAEEHKRAERFVYPGFGLSAAAVPVATSYSLPVAKTILPAVAPAITSYAAPAIAPAITSYAAPAITSYAAPAIAPAITSYAAPAVAAAPVVSSFGYPSYGYSGLGYGYGAPLLKK